MNIRHKEIIRSLMKKHAHAMVQLTYRRVFDWHLAEDLVQETFLTACFKAEQICSHEKPVAWLYNTLNKITMRELKRAYRTCEIYGSELDVVATNEIELSMEYYLPKGLNPKEQDLIIMRIEKRLSFSQIAEYYGVTEEACRQRFSRVVKKCRALIEKEDAFSNDNNRNTHTCHKTETSRDE